MRRRTSWLMTLGAAALLFPGAAAAAPELFCQRDETTGISMPNGGKGVCVQQSATSRAVTLYTEDGLLIAQTDTFGLAGTGSPSLLQFIGAPVELLYCAAAQLNPDTGTPTSQCITPDGRPGPGALTGVGTIQANATVGLLGSLQCPSSIHIRGIVHSPGGEAFEVQGSLLRFLDSTDGTTCETVTEELSTDYLGPASKALPGKFSRLGVAETKALGDAALPDLDSEDMRLREAVANLDEHQFQLLKSLTRLTPDGWEDLASHLEADGGALIGKLDESDQPVPPGTEVIARSAATANPKSAGSEDNRGTGGIPRVLQEIAALDGKLEGLDGKLDFITTIVQDTNTTQKDIEAHTANRPFDISAAICFEATTKLEIGGNSETKGTFKADGAGGADVYGNGITGDITLGSKGGLDVGKNAEVDFPKLVICVEGGVEKNTGGLGEARQKLIDKLSASQQTIREKVTDSINAVDVSGEKLERLLTLIDTSDVDLTDPAKLVGEGAFRTFLTNVISAMPLNTATQSRLQGQAKILESIGNKLKICDNLDTFPAAIKTTLSPICANTDGTSLQETIVSIKDAIFCRPDCKDLFPCPAAGKAGCDAGSSGDACRTKCDSRTTCLKGCRGEL